MRGVGQETIRAASRWGLRGKIAAGIGLVACSTVVWQSSHAAFSDTTSNDNNNLAAGTVTITDNDSGAALFSTPPLLAPGATATNCIGVKYTGTLTPALVKAYITTPTEMDANSGTYATWTSGGPSTLDNTTNLLIEVNNADLPTAPTLPLNCSDPALTFTTLSAAAPGTLLTTLFGTNVDFSSGLPSGGLSVAKDNWRVFRFTYTVNSGATNAVQGDGVNFKVVWEAQK